MPRNWFVEVRGVLHEQFAKGIGPDGSAWKATKRNRPALISKKIPNSVGFYAVEKGVGFKMRIDWLEAHHRGHTFPARSGGGQKLRFTAKGKLDTAGRFAKRTAGAEIGYEKDGYRSFVKAVGKKRRQKFVGFETLTAAHSIRARVLPARPIFPETSIPARWGAAINRGAQNGLEAWAAAFAESP